MAKVREGLAKGKKELDSSQEWFESWFNSSPWLTPLISVVVEPLLVLLITLTVGPCIINRLVQFVKQRFSPIPFMVHCTNANECRSAYYSIPNEDEIEFASYSHQVEEPRVQD